MFKFNDCDLSNYIGSVISYRLNIDLPNDLPELNKQFFQEYQLEGYEEELISLVINRVKTKGVSILNYGGTQYGYYRDLGDGRSGYIGSLLYKGQYFDISIKGIGITKYSKGNGLCNKEEYKWELLQGNHLSLLDIPSTRVIGGWINPNNETYIYIRLTKSLIRVGTIEYLSRLHNANIYINLCCEYYMYYVMDLIYESREEFFIHILSKYKDICNTWEKNNFIHGRLNSDNVLLCGWVHDGIKVNTTDIPNMYSSSNQRYAIGLSMEYLGLALNISQSTIQDLIYSTLIME